MFTKKLSKIEVECGLIRFGADNREMFPANGETVRFIDNKGEEYVTHIHRSVNRVDGLTAMHKNNNVKVEKGIKCGELPTRTLAHQRKHDRMTLFNLGVYDDNHKEEILSDVVYSIVELERERRYYNQARIPVQTGKIDLSGIGLADAEVMSGLMDWNEFADTFADIDIDAVLDTTAIYDRQCELLI